MFVFFSLFSWGRKKTNKFHETYIMIAFTSQSLKGGWKKFAMCSDEPTEVKNRKKDNKKSSLLAVHMNVALNTMLIQRC